MSAKTIHFKISLLEIQPTIWRTFTVTDNYRIDRLHQVIQISMGWFNSHLHEFRFNDRTIGMVMDEMYDLPSLEDETALYIRDLKLKQGDTIAYLYDFGDSWEHRLQVEKITSTSEPHPLCTGGDMACPPEDCGGCFGYMNLLEVLTNPQHEEYQSWKQWLPENFNPQTFSLEQINRELDKFGKWRRKFPFAISSPWHQI